MKARLEQLTLTNVNSSFLSYEVNMPAFEFVWHYHPEFELTLILNGKGKRLVGDSYQNFEPGDLVLLGSYLPHTWVSDEAYKGVCSAVVIQFSNHFIDPLLQYNELKDIKQLLKKAEKGLYFKNDNKEIKSLLKKIMENQGADTFISLIQVLQKLSKTNAFELSSEHFKPFRGNEDQHRINKIFVHVQNNYSAKISIQKAALLAHMSESAFCKFFKRVSGKTFSDYVNDVRIARACELLIETDKPIEQIAFDIGFESQTYFNRVFLKKKGNTPSDYRKPSVGNKQPKMHN
jgi:AraC-like DNA-binding protein